MKTKMSKLHRKHLPATLASTDLSDGRYFFLHVFLASSPGYVDAWYAAWGGLPRRDYLTYNLADSTLTPLEVSEGQRVDVQPGEVLVVVYNYRAQPTRMAVYANDPDVPKLLGAGNPDNMPSRVRADYIDDLAGELPRRGRRKLTDLARLLRRVTQ